MDPFAPLPVVLPLVGAALVALLEKSHERHRLLDFATVAVTLAVIAFDIELLFRSSGATIVYWFGGWQPVRGFPLGIAFAIDPAGAALALLAAVLTLCGLMFSWHYFKAIGTFYHSLMLLFLASMGGFCLTGDLFNMFVFFELMGVAAYALTGYRIEDTGPLEGALNFSVMNSIGAFMVLLGIGILYSRTGGLNLAWVGARVAERPVDAAVACSFMLLAIGFLVKAAVVPFHFWLPDAHAVAPTPASVLFSGIMVELGLYAVARIYWTIFSGTIPGGTARTLLLAAGLATAMVGGVMAFLQRHLKRLLAYSTVSHSGLMLSAIALFDPASLGGCLIYLAGHGLVKGGLFITSGIILYHFHSVDEETLRSAGTRLRFVGAIFCLLALALAGLPPFGTFTGKALIEARAAELGLTFIAPVFLVASSLTGAAVLRAGLTIFYGIGTPNCLSAPAPTRGDHESRETSGKESRTPLMMLFPLLLLVVLALAVGLLPSLPEKSLQAAVRLCDQRGYQTTVLSGNFAALVPAPLPQPTELSKGLLPAGLAVVLAAAALFGLPLPDRLVRGLKTLLRPMLSTLRHIHSGYIGDYVTWFVIGAAVMVVVAATSRLL